MLRSISFYLIFCALFSLPAYSKKVIDRTLVTVNDEVILRSDVERFLVQARSKSFQELFGGITEEQLKNEESILQLLIDEKIINQQVKRLELQATEQEIEGQIRAIEKRNGISRKQLESRLAQLGTTMAEYREGLKRQIERRNLIEREIRPLLEVSDDQVKNYYSALNSQKGNETEYRIAHIYFDPKRPGPSAKARAEKVYAELGTRPESFAELVKDYSDDASTASSGGELGFFTPASLSAAFRKVVPTIKEGSVSKPVKTDSGYHIIKVLETRAADFTTLSAERKAEVTYQMTAAQMEKKMALWLERKKREAHIRRSDEVSAPKQEPNP